MVGAAARSSVAEGEQTTGTTMGNMSASVTTTLSEPPRRAALRARRDEILRLAARRGVSNVRVFGSVARGDATVDSDIDLLVDFDTSHRGLDLFAFAREVEELLDHRVDVGTEVHPVVRKKVEAEAVPL
jgi:predicted nucleotidyltransferase